MPERKRFFSLMSSLMRNCKCLHRSKIVGGYSAETALVRGTFFSYRGFWIKITHLDRTDSFHLKNEFCFCHEKAPIILHYLWTFYSPLILVDTCECSIWCLGQNIKNISLGTVPHFATLNWSSIISESSLHYNNRGRPKKCPIAFFVTFASEVCFWCFRAFLIPALKLWSS